MFSSAVVITSSSTSRQSGSSRRSRRCCRPSALDPIILCRHLPQPVTHPRSRPCHKTGAMGLCGSTKQDGGVGILPEVPAEGRAPAGVGIAEAALVAELAAFRDLGEFEEGCGRTVRVEHLEQFLRGLVGLKRLKLCS